MERTIFDELFDISNEMNRIFDRARMGSEITWSGRWPQANLYEHKDSYIIVAKIPGVEKKDLDISIKDNSLTIRGTRNNDKPEGAKLHLSERFSGEFERSFMLGDHINVEAIEAEVQNGLLIVRLPKVEQAQSRKIEIK